MDVYSGYMSEELVVDPMSLEVEPHLYLFCWQQFGKNQFATITGRDESSNIVTNFQIIKKRSNDKTKYCIERRDSSIYIISFPISLFQYEQRTIAFKIKFNSLLGPQMDIIQLTVLQKGLHFKVNPTFAGIEDMISPSCTGILVTEYYSVKKIQMFTIHGLKEDFFPISSGSKFSFYYTCNVKNFFESSTKFVEKHGTIEFDERITDLEPIVQIPFRRFIKASWNYNSFSAKRYDLAIYEKNGSKNYSCLKVFRIYINRYKKEHKTPSLMAIGCQSDIPVEDMGYFDDTVVDGRITVILDMIKPLRYYNLHKFQIFWLENYVKKNAYLHFNPLVNEFIGTIDSTVFDLNSSNYDSIRNKIPKQNQAVINKNNDNPYKSSHLQIHDYTNLEVYSSITTKNGYASSSNASIKVSELYKNSHCPKNFYPFFYAFYYSRKGDEVIAEIVQLPIVLDKENQQEIIQLEFEPNNVELNFRIKWTISGYSKTPTPALYAIELNNIDTNLCAVTYILWCKTCNKIYKTITNDSINSRQQFNIRCPIKEIDNYFDAGHSTVVFDTDPMKPYDNYSVKIYAFTFNSVSETDYSAPKYISHTIWQKFRLVIVVPVFVVIVVIFMIVGLIIKCRSGTTTGKKKTIPVKGRYDPEEIYDEDNTDL